ncbi:MAG: FAD-binding oxidoreductase [Acidobacteria bacterium]|nr:FAD-binding oxidoreductase [Acidobacteriota bacterium]
MNESRWEQALIEWRAAIGRGHVDTAGPAISAASTATFATTQVIPAILRPASRDEVVLCVQIANRHRIPVYPISTGKNWGYGSRVPARTQTVILDLARLNRIVEFSEELAYVTVEPGVTQQQLFDFLIANNSSLWMDATGSTRDSSVLGNTIERGFGHTPYGEHFAFASGMEVVLPTGEVIDTGFGRFSNARSGAVYRWGVGPSLDGLFSQSNFGIVTRMTIALMPAPEYFQAFFFRCDRPAQLEPVIASLSRLRLSGALPSTVHIGNDYRVISGLRQYPWERTNETTPLTPDAMKGLRKELNFGLWNGSGGLYGTRAQVAESRRLLRAGLSGSVSRLVFIDDAKLSLSIRYARPIRFFTSWDLSRALDVLKPVYGLLKGVPTDQPLRGAYWRKRSEIPADMDPDRDGCGLLWFAPVIPARAEDIDRLHRATSEILLHDGFEPMISLTLISGRAIAAVISISYDRAIAGEDNRAMKCYHRLVEAINALGYYSYRLGVQSMAEMNNSPSYAACVRSIKHALDPNEILAPGRYEPSPLSTTAKQR